MIFKNTKTEDVYILGANEKHLIERLKKDADYIVLEKIEKETKTIEKEEKETEKKKTTRKKASKTTQNEPKGE